LGREGVDGGKDQGGKVWKGDTGTSGPAGRRRGEGKTPGGQRQKKKKHDRKEEKRKHKTEGERNPGRIFVVWFPKGKGVFGNKTRPSRKVVKGPSNLEDGQKKDSESNQLTKKKSKVLHKKNVSPTGSKKDCTITFQRKQRRSKEKQFGNERETRKEPETVGGEEGSRRRRGKGGLGGKVVPPQGGSQSSLLRKKRKCNAFGAALTPEKRQLFWAKKSKGRIMNIRKEATTGKTVPKGGKGETQWRHGTTTLVRQTPWHGFDSSKPRPKGLRCVLMTRRKRQKRF